MIEKTATKSLSGNTKTDKDKKKPAKKPINWVFTLFAEDPLEYDPEYMKWLAYARETCPTTGRKHWQSFIGMHEQMSLTAFKKFLLKKTGKQVHCEGMFGSLTDNEAYCSKEGTLIKFGVFPKQGERKDLNWWKEEIMSGRMTPDDILLENPMMYHQYGRTIERIYEKFCEKRYRTYETRTEGLWLHGATGTKKSLEALEGYTPEDFYIFPNDLGWWDGYNGQKIVVINEYRYDHPIKFRDLLDLMDWTPYYVRRRNRRPFPFTSKKVIITSPLAPTDIWKEGDESKDNIAQLLRRIVVKEKK